MTLYAASAVAEYWIVNLIERVVEVYREPRAGRFTRIERHKAAEVISPQCFPDIVVALSELLK